VARKLSPRMECAGRRPRLIGMLGTVVTGRGRDQTTGVVFTFLNKETHMPLTHVYERARSLALFTKTHLLGRACRWVHLAAVGIVSLLGVAAFAGPALATPQPASTGYAFTTLDNQSDPTFNQLLGINQSGTIAGYFGSGAAGHPNKGYLLTPPYAQSNYAAENFPGSVQTQVTGLNDQGVTVGFWSPDNTANLMNANLGFYSIDGHRPHTVMFPTDDNSTPPVDQLLGVNDRNVAVGFYTDGEGNNHGFTYSIGRHHHRYNEVTVSGASSVTAAAINNRGDIAGFNTDAQGNVDSFLLSRWGHETTLDFPGATSTQALGVNDSDEVVGVYTNSDMSTHGFTWTPQGGFATVDDPNGMGTTTINGVNDAGALVGFYVDGAGNTDGTLAMPLSHHRHH
jgi:hypothetical protein